jgi:sugar lactone lactonase YvrE
VCRALLLIGALLVLGGCTTRERTNPLDPRNTVTQGSLIGFNAIAADSVVELRWPPLGVQGVLGYRVQRWRPGGVPQSLGASDYNPDATAAEDPDVRNDSTYVYRLIAHLDTGDSVLSAPDTVTPGTRRIFALAAGTPSLLRLTPDARDVLYELQTKESYVDMELDRSTGVLWFAAETSGEVVRRTPDGAITGSVIETGAPGDLSVSSNRGLGWVVSLTTGSVTSYGPDLNDASPHSTIGDVPDPRIVEAGTTDPSVWVGDEGGEVYRFQAQDLVRTNVWSLAAGPIRAIALDEARGGAWVATRAPAGTLYHLDPTDSSATLVRFPLSNAADLAVDPATGDLWIAERGPANLGAGRLSLITRAGVTLATVGSIEPYGIDVDPVDGSCWISDLHSNRILQISRSGATLRASPPLPTPYAVRVDIP